MANQINKIISTKVKYIVCDENLIKRQALRKCISLELKTSGAIKSSLHRDYGKIWWLQNRCAKLLYAGRLYEVL